MFPIPWNKAYRKKDGTLVTMEDIAGGGGGGGGGSLSFKIKEVEIPSRSSSSKTYYVAFEPDEGYTPIAVSFELTGTSAQSIRMFTSLSTKRSTAGGSLEWEVALLCYESAITTDPGIAHVLEVEI